MANTQSRIEAIRNRYKTKTTSNIKRIRNFNQSVQEEDDDEYNIWKRKLDEQINPTRYDPFKGTDQNKVKDLMLKHAQNQQKIIPKTKTKDIPLVKSKKQNIFQKGASLATSFLEGFAKEANKANVTKDAFKGTFLETDYSKDPLALGIQKGINKLTTGNVNKMPQLNQTALGIGGVSENLLEMIALGKISSPITKGISKLTQNAKPIIKKIAPKASEAVTIGAGLGALKTKKNPDESLGKNILEETAFMSGGLGATGLIGKGLGKTAIPKFGKGIIEGAGFGAGGSTTQQALKREFNPEDLKANIIGGAVLGGAISSSGIFNKVLRRNPQTNNIAVEPLKPETKPIETKPETIKKSKYKDVMDLHNKKYAEYKKAENNWETAVYDIQNKFGQKELTVPEQLKIKTELGYNIEKLANNYDLKTNEYISAQKALEKNISRKAKKESSPELTETFKVREDFLPPTRANNLEPLDKKGINQLKNNINKNKNKIETETQYITDPIANTKSKLGNIKESIKRGYDRYYDVSKISKNANELLNLENQSSGTVDYILNKKLVNKKGVPISDLSFKDVLTMKDKTRQKFYEDYLLNRHNIDRYKTEKTLLTDKNNNKITPEQSNQIIKKYEEQFPEFKEIANNYDNMWQGFTREYLPEFIGEKNVENLISLYSHYVPSYRQKTSFNEIVPSNKITGGVKIREATGSNKNILPVNEQIASQVSKIVKSSRRNEALNYMLDPIISNPDKYKNMAEIVKVGKNKYSNATEQEIANQIANMNKTDVDGNALTNLVNAIENPLKQSMQDGYLTVFREGNPITLKINDKNLFKALNNYNKGEVGSLMKVYNNMLQTFKGAITSYNPFFSVRNTIRDTPTAYVQGKTVNPAKFAKERVESVASIMTNDPLWQQYEALGGRLNTISSNPLAPTSKLDSKVLSAPKKVWNKYTDILEIAEQFNRFAEFKKIYKKTGEDVNQARIAAANVTTNFGKGGTLIKQIDKVFPFTNAAVQGTGNSIKAFKDKPGQSIGKAILSTTIPAALLYSYNTKDKDRKKIYDEIPNSTKNTNYVFVLDEETIIKLPKTQQVALLFSSLAERAMDFAKGDKKAFEEGLTTLKKSAIPIDLKSGFLNPAINVKMGGNKDYFGRDIIPQSLSRLSPGQQFDDRSTNVSKWLGEEFNVSPKQTDYLMDSYLGVVYDIMKKSDQTTGIVEGVKDVAKSNFSVNPNYTRTTGAYYDLKDKISKEKADFNKLIANKKKEVTDRGYTTNSKIGKQLLNNSLTETEKQTKKKIDEISKVLSEQDKELEGLTDKDRKNKLFDLFKQLENYKR